MRVAEACSCALLALFAGAALAADPQQGKPLYETHCGTCHYEKLHNRKTTNIKTIVALKLEVAKWAAQTNRRFTQAELDDIAEYLNESHYRLAR